MMGKHISPSNTVIVYILLVFFFFFLSDKTYATKCQSVKTLFPNILKKYLKNKGLWNFQKNTVAVMTCN